MKKQGVNNGYRHLESRHMSTSMACPSWFPGSLRNLASCILGCGATAGDGWSGMQTSPANRAYKKCHAVGEHPCRHPLCLLKKHAWQKAQAATGGQILQGSWTIRSEHVVRFALAEQRTHTHQHAHKPYVCATHTPCTHSHVFVTSCDHICVHHTTRSSNACYLLPAQNAPSAQL